MWHNTYHSFLSNSNPHDECRRLTVFNIQMWKLFISEQTHYYGKDCDGLLAGGNSSPSPNTLILIFVMAIL